MEKGSQERIDLPPRVPPTSPHPSRIARSSAAAPAPGTGDHDRWERCGHPGGHRLRGRGRGLGAEWAEAFAPSLQGLTRDEVAGRLQIMQPPVDQRRRPGGQRDMSVPRAHEPLIFRRRVSIAVFRTGISVETVFQVALISTPK